MPPPGAVSATPPTAEGDTDFFLTTEFLIIIISGVSAVVIAIVGYLMSNKERAADCIRFTNSVAALVSRKGPASSSDSGTSTQDTINAVLDAAERLNKPKTTPLSIEDDVTGATPIAKKASATVGARDDTAYVMPPQQPTDPSM